MSTAKALENAIQTGDAGAVRAILSASPDLVHHRIEKNLTPLLLAAYNRRPDIAEILLEHGARLDVCAASISGKLEALQSLLEEAPSRARSRSPDGYSALHLASRFDQREAAAVLLRFGADVNEASNDRRMTPLHWAASVPVAELLVAHGADVNAAAGNGTTALHFATASNHIAMVQWLLAHGADPARKTKAGQTPWAVAAKMGRHQIAHLLFYHHQRGSSTT
jgi:ankyrin repeat protein